MKDTGTQLPKFDFKKMTPKKFKSKEIHTQI